MLFGTVPLGLGWAGQWYFDKDFSSSDLNFQTLSISVPVYSTKLAGGVGLHVIPYFNWVKSNPSNFDQIVPGLAVSLSARLADKTSLGVTVLQSYAHYQHYLPSVFTENRNDWNTTAIVNLTHKITKNLEVRLEARYTNNTSNLKALEFTSGKTVKLYSYDAWLFTPTVAVNYSF